MKKMRLLPSAVLAANLLLCAVFSGCSNDKESKKRAYIVSKSDDNNWTTSARILCDSFDMVSNNECVFYVDGRKATLRGKMIKCFSNPEYVSDK